MMDPLVEHEQLLRTLAVVSASKKKSKLRKLNTKEWKFMTELLHYYYKTQKINSTVTKKIRKLFRRGWNLQTVKRFLNKNVAILTTVIIEVLLFKCTNGRAV